MPKVSVLMPAYNAAQYIGEAIQSILDQSFTDFEFIIIDDCSTDNTWEIIQQYASIDSRIMVSRNKQNLNIA
jgi:glycosyltransferase involved in cell wall biosynthesis